MIDQPDTRFDAQWRSRCHVREAARKDVETMIGSHYLGKWPGVCTLILAMIEGERPVGVVVFALPPRETAKRYGGETWELARLWIEDGIPSNGESWLIAKAVKYVKNHKKTVRVLVSYADPSAGHSGTIYRAANWESDGRTDQERKTPRFDYADAATGKKYSRRGHVPPGIEIKRVPRVSKLRFILRVRP